MKKLWGGRFKKKTEPMAERFTSSIALDRRLAKYDVLCSIAHARMLGRCGIISKKDSAKLAGALLSISKAIKNGTFIYDGKAEDVHTNIQDALRKKIGRVAEKLHTGRSRNDLAVTDLRMYCKDEIDRISSLSMALQNALVKFADSNKKAIIPGYTHLQRAQPVLFAHHILAYVEMLERDRERLADASIRADVMPLGSCALAGTSLPINREFLAKELGFAELSGNSMDAVGDRDFAAEILSALAILAMHLSRFAEEMILWSSQEFGFVELGEEFCTGSSIMPHKKNPDVLELIRANAGAIYGNLLSLLTMMKGLPMAYNRDMQLDKRPLFDSIDTVKSGLEILRGVITNTTVNIDNAEAAASDELLCAADVAEYLVKKGVSFAKAHEAVGRVIRYSLDAKKRIKDMPLDRLKSFCGAFDKDLYRILDARSCVESKRSPGATSAPQVTRQLRAWKRRLRG